jgi:hypothetical protein
VSFVAEFNSLPLDALVKRSLATGTAAARESHGKIKIVAGRFRRADFAGGFGISGAHGPARRTR